LKISTIKSTDHKNIEELKEDLNKFLIYYNTNSNLVELKKNLKPEHLDEVIKIWFDIEAGIFKISPDDFLCYSLKWNGAMCRNLTSIKVIIF